MNLEIKFSPEAEETFNAVVAQLEQRWGNKFADKFRSRVDESLDIISETPFLYPLANESSTLRKCILRKNCAMLYRVFNDKIEIFCFLDNRQDPLFIP